MMFSGQQATNAFNKFKWKRHGESSLSARLLNDVPPEIELSDYHRAPSPGSESPSGLLNGESLCVDPIPDLDLFIERVYSYYCEKGFLCIIIRWIVELLSLAFTICFTGFFLLFVNWIGLRNAKCGMDAVESGIKPCDLAKEALHQHPLTPFTPLKAIIVGYLGIFSIYWIFCFVRFFAQLKETLKIREFYHNSLGVTDRELQTMPWAFVLEKVVQIQTLQQLCVVRDLSAQDIVMRLMRKENYLIGMVNKGVLAFPVPQWVPGACPVVKSEPNGAQNCLVLPKTLEWILNWCILQSMFDRNYCVRRDFIADPKTLKKRLILVGLGMLLLSPFLVIFMLVYLFLRHAEQFYHHPSLASSRRWSNISKWMFREFNEVDHLFKHRINSSVSHASNYLNQFPAPMLTIIAKFISFVFGGFTAILLIIAFLEESLLEGHIYGRNLFWYAAVFGAITAISRPAVSDDLLVFDPQGAMSMVVQHTHYMPKRWRGKENTDYVRMQFETLFQYTGMMLLEEMTSIFLTPYLLIFVVPKRVDDILQFIVDFTVDVEGVGHVCSFSLFDFRNHGNKRYGSPHNSARTHRSSQGKMEKSFLSFRSSYPSWEPDSYGKQFLLTIKTFREQKFQGHGTRQGHLNPRQQYTPDFGGQTYPNNHFSGEMAQNTSRFDYHLDLLIDSDQKNYPYILDWFYTSQPQSIATTSNPEDKLASFADGENLRDVWVPPNMNQDEPPYDENWGSLFDDHRSRSTSHLEASTSAPLFQQSVLQQHHDFDNAAQNTKSHWWARGNRQAMEPQTSFLDPPNFNRPQRVEPETSFLDPPIFNRPQRVEPQASFLEPPNFNRPLVEEPQSSFLEPPGLDCPQVKEPQTNFLESPSFNRPQRVELQTSFLEPTNLNRSQEVGPHTSFLEPPQNNYNNFYDNFSDRSFEEQEQHLDWRSPNRLSQTFYMDDLEGGEFNLPFDDIYSRHSQSPDRNHDPTRD